jgi:integrin alpha 8
MIRLGVAPAASSEPGRRDVVIGALFLTNFTNTEGKFETRCVYIYYQGARGTYRTSGILEGDVSKARFGLSVTSLGDINLHGFNDIAVGAPP